MRNVIVSAVLLVFASACEREERVEKQREEVREQVGEVREEARDVKEEAREVGEEMRDLPPEMRELSQERREALQAAAARDGYMIQIEADGSITAWRERQPVAGAMPSDAEIEAALRDRIQKEAPKLADKIMIQVKDGTVTLTGTVEDIADVSRLLKHSLDVKGVDRVTSRLTY